MKKLLILLAFFIVSSFSFSQDTTSHQISLLTSFIINKKPTDSASCEIRIWEIDYNKPGLGLNVPVIYKEFSDKCIIQLFPGDYAIEYRTGDKLLHMENITIPADNPVKFHKYILWRPVPFSEFDFKILSNIKVRDIIYMEF